MEKEMATYSSILARIIHEQRSLVGYSPWGHRVMVMSGRKVFGLKVQVWESSACR